jgi:transcriptional regulator with XRE-family HTH domain
LSRPSCQERRYTQMDTFTNRLREACRHKDINQAELANALGVTRASVSLWWKGNEPGRTNFKKLVKFLDVRDGWLRGEGDTEVTTTTNNNNNQTQRLVGNVDGMEDVTAALQHTLADDIRRLAMALQKAALEMVDAWLQLSAPDREEIRKLVLAKAAKAKRAKPNGSKARTRDKSKLSNGSVRTKAARATKE